MPDPCNDRRVAQVMYPAYRRYDASRIAANNSMIALLAGAHLASHSLQLMKGSSVRLAEIFPVVPHVDRFNLSVDRARSVLVDAENHLGAVAVPYALAVHEDFITSAVDWIDQLGLRRDPAPGMTLRAWNMHEILFASAGVVLPHPTIEHFHLLREMRNCQIHAGGDASQRVVDAIAAVEAVGHDDWIKLTGRPPADVVVDGRIEFTVGDIIVSFATSKWLARDANDLLIRLVPRSEWATVATGDFATTDAGRRRLRNSDQWMKSLYGYAHHLYRSLGLTRRELADGAIASGLWTRRLASLPSDIRP